MAIEGPLKELGIHDVFQLLDLSRKTGILSVTSELRHNHGTIYVDAGTIVFAEIESNPHPLGELLLRAGKVTEADFHRARAMQEQGDGRRLGEILVAIGAMSQRELERQVGFQIEEVVFAIMSWREGYFSFEEGQSERIPAEATVRIRIEALLMEGARRIDEWSRIEGKIPHVGVVPSLVPSDSHEEGQVDLLPTEWEVLAAIDGDRDLRQIAEMLVRSEFDVAKTVFGLESAAIVTVTDPGSRPAEAAAAGANVDDLLEQVGEALEAGDIETARGWAESAKSQSPHDPSVYLALGRLELAGGHTAEAEEHLRRALRLDPMLAPAHRLLGDALALRGRFQEACEWWERWLKVSEQVDEAEVQKVHDAVRAAATLDTFLRYPRG